MVDGEEDGNDTEADEATNEEDQVETKDPQSSTVKSRG